MGKTVIDMYKVQINFFYFTSFLALKKIKQYVPPCRRLQKGYKIKLF